MTGPVVRQPIFDRTREVTAYNLLIRGGIETVADGMQGDGPGGRADLERIAGGKRVFLQLSRLALLEEGYVGFAPASTVLEVGESIGWDADVLAACQRLKESGFGLAMGHFAVESNNQPALELADAVTVDLRRVDAVEWLPAPGRVGRTDVEWLLANVADHEEFADGVANGYHYFRGPFYEKPISQSRSEIPTSKLSYLRFLDEINRPTLDLLQIQKLLERDLSLSLKLFRYLNSAAFGWRQEVTSIRHALRLLGETSLKKWASLVAVASVGSTKPSELVISSLLRAKFCELLARNANLAERENELFLLGLLSRLDALLDRSMEDALDEVNPSADIKGALLEQESPFSLVYRTARAFEGAQWGVADEGVGQFLTNGASIASLYHEARAWADETFRA